jgi:hypothetical protein
MELNGDSLLSIKGIHCATISNVSPPVPHAATYVEVLSTWPKWASPESQGQSYIGGNSLLDAYCATLACNQLRERFPQHNHAPGLTDAAFVLSTEDLELIEYECLTEHQRAYMRNLVHSPMGRHFFNTLEEYIGLAVANS